MNDFIEYQDVSRRTAQGYADPTDGSMLVERKLTEEQAKMMFLALGINGEAGEIAEKVKKHVREDDDSYIDGLEAELGDVIWYMAQLTTLLGGDFGEDVAFANLEKLFDRKERGVITGEGDDR